MAKELNVTINAIVSNIRTLEFKEKSHNKELKVLHNQDDLVGVSILELTHLVETNKCSDIIKSDLIDLFKLSGKHNYFFPDCPKDVYVYHFEVRYNEFLDEYTDVSKFDFLKQELELFYNLKKHRFLYGVSSEEVDYSQYIQGISHFDFSLKAKIKFLEEELEEIGYSYSYEDNIGFYDDDGVLVGDGFDVFFKKIEDFTTEEIQPKNAKQLTTNQIVVLLDKLGFFTHPNIEEASKVKQAELISLITGLNSKNIKTNIQKLDKKASVNGDSYQKDIDKIDKILDGLV